MKKQLYFYIAAFICNAPCSKTFCMKNFNNRLRRKTQIQRSQAKRARAQRVRARAQRVRAQRVRAQAQRVRVQRAREQKAQAQRAREEIQQIKNIISNDIMPIEQLDSMGYSKENIQKALKEFKKEAIAVTKTKKQAPTKPKVAPRVAPKKTKPTIRPRPNQRRPRPRPRPARPARQADDHFVQMLRTGGFVKDYALLPDGSYVIQLNAASQVRGPTCGVSALRNSMLVLNYFFTKNVRYLNIIKNQNDMKKYTDKVITSNIPNQNIHSDTIENILKGNIFEVLPPNYKKDNDILITANYDNTMVIDNIANIFFIDELILEITKIKHCENNEFWSFILRTGATEQSASKAKLKKIAKSGGHWVSVSVIKMNNKLYWFVVNSCSGNIINTAKSLIDRT